MPGSSIGNYRSLIEKASLKSFSVERSSPQAFSMASRAIALVYVFGHGNGLVTGRGANKKRGVAAAFPFAK
jgi:hypothetical protein